LPSRNLTRRTTLTAFATAAVAALAARPLAARADDATVTIDNFSFAPETLTVAAGTKVTFTNRDDIPHTVVSTAHPPAFRSSPLDTGDSFSFTFAAAGSFPYFCSLHPHMQGTIVVT